MTAVKKDALLFCPSMKAATARAKPCPPSPWNAATATSTATTPPAVGVPSQWHDPNDAQEKSELIGEDDNPKRLRHTYPNQEAAEQAAKAEMNRVKRDKETLQFTLALGRSDIPP